MIVIRTCWYLCVLFLVMLGAASLMTVAPGGEATKGILMSAFLALSLLCAGAALLLRRKFRRNPEAIIFKSKIASGISIGIATILTLFLLSGVIG